VDSEGDAFPDKQGTLLSEKFWLRSWTNETYLWNTEVADTDPNLTPARTDYFDSLRTFAKTSSGKDKDNFHFSITTEEYLKQRNATASARPAYGETGYGARFVILAATPPRDIRVAFTEPNSPASGLENGKPRLVRGAKIIKINGIDAVYGGATDAEIDALNVGLYPTATGVSTTLVVREPGAVVDRTITITSADVATKPVNQTKVIPTATGKVGYILFNTFSPYASELEIKNAVDAMKTAGINDLVLDLRYNGGGLLTVASQLSYMIAGASQTSGKIFEASKFNAAAGNKNPITGAINTPSPFQTTGVGFSVPDGQALPTLNLKRVFILATGSTCSASESVINGLRGIDVEVVLIGGTTCGKPYGFYPTSNCGLTYFSIQFQGVNHKGFGDYADGFAPANSTAAYPTKITGCAVADDFSKGLGDQTEGLFAAALRYRNTATCPTPSSNASAVSKSVFTSTTSSIKGRALSEPAPRIYDINRDMTRGGR
jgi:C-terminal processing protease CtpA/Prc